MCEVHIALFARRTYVHVTRSEKNSRLFVRCVTRSRWLKDDEEAFQWTYEKRVNTFRMPGGGAKIADPQLENRLLEVAAEV